MCTSVILQATAKHFDRVDQLIEIIILLPSGTGNVLKIQEMLHICSEHFEQKDDEEKDKDSKDKDSKDKDKDKKEAEKSDDGSHQGVAVLGIALVAMGEEIGAQMALRTCNHLVCSLFAIYVNLPKISKWY